MWCPSFLFPYKKKVVYCQVKLDLDGWNPRIRIICTMRNFRTYICFLLWPRVCFTYNFPILVCLFNFLVPVFFACNDMNIATPIINLVLAICVLQSGQRNMRIKQQNNSWIWESTCFCRKADLCTATAASPQTLQYHSQLLAPGKTANSIRLFQTGNYDRKPKRCSQYKR